MHCLFLKKNNEAVKKNQIIFLFITRYCSYSKGLDKIFNKVRAFYTLKLLYCIISL